MASGAYAPVGAFSSSQADDTARDLWCTRLGFSQGRLTLPLAQSIGGGRLKSAPSLPKLGGPDDPGRMIKDWSFYKFRPYNSDLNCAMNKYGPDFRWPGMNNTPVRARRPQRFASERAQLPPGTQSRLRSRARSSRFL